MKFILASGSPRRKELLTQIGIGYEVRVSSTEELSDAEDPAALVEELSIYKCQDVAEGLGMDEKDICIIGADTVVALDGEILGKPEDEEDAFNMLKKLSGREHQVFTGVTLLIHRDGETDTLLTFHEETKVIMYEMTDDEIKAYIATGEPMDKAGAYGIQARAAAFVKGIDGDYNNVVGLPIARLYHEMRNLRLI